MTDRGDKKPERRTKTRTNDPVKIQKRPRENETEMEEKAARQNGMTDVSSPGASSSVLISAPSIPLGPPIPSQGKRELDKVCDDDEAPEKSQKL